MRKIITYILIISFVIGHCTISTTSSEIERNEVEIVANDLGLFEALYISASCLPMEEDIEALANTIYGEAGGIRNDTHRSAVAWCVINRYINCNYEKTILEIVSKPKQYTGYNPNRQYKTQKEIELYNHCKWLAKDVLTRFYLEKMGIEEVGRTLPKDYLWFYGDGKVNHFRNAYKGDYDIWDWSLESPYKNN